MSHIERTVIVFARPTHDRRAVYFEGVDGTEDDYGKVQIVRRVVTETVADGDVRRVLHRDEEVEVLVGGLDPDAVATLIGSLGTAMADSLRVREGVRL